MPHHICVAVNKRSLFCCCCCCHEHSLGQMNGPDIFCLSPTIQLRTTRRLGQQQQSIGQPYEAYFRSTHVHERNPLLLPVERRCKFEPNGFKPQSSIYWAGGENRARCEPFGPVTKLLRRSLFLQRHWRQQLHYAHPLCCGINVMEV